MSDNNKFLTQNSKSPSMGTQKLYSFPNGYGASVVKHEYSYGGDRGLWELAVINNISEDGFDICYDTPITDDVIGFLNDPEVDRLLYLIPDL
ncbi:uncharacterized protein METZ01_LOCUS423218 [marine metagenome]|uniref:Uncharacterized protein n=1 Tax=marine metagenome TaxID=408172 RepID=A0A382XHS0_9ZZZZ